MDWFFITVSFLIVSIPVSISGVEYGKGILLLLLFYRLYKHQTNRPYLIVEKMTLPNILLIVFSALILLSIVFTDTFGTFEDGTIKRLPALAGFTILFASVYLFYSLTKFKRIIYYFLTSCLVVFVWNIYKYGTSRGGGFFGNPVVYSHLLSVLMPLFLAVIIKEIRYGMKNLIKIKTIFISLLFTASIIFFFNNVYYNTSRSLILSFIVSFVLLIFYHFPKKISIGIIVSGLVLIVLFLPKGYKDRIKTMKLIYYKTTPVLKIEDIDSLFIERDGEMSRLVFKLGDVSGFGDNVSSRAFVLPQSGYEYAAFKSTRRKRYYRSNEYVFNLEKHEKYLFPKR